MKKNCLKIYQNVLLHFQIRIILRFVYFLTMLL